MKKNIIIVLVGIIAIAGSVFVKQNVFQQKEVLKNENSIKSYDKNDTLYVGYQASYAIDMKNKDQMYSAHDYIAIIQVDKLNSATTYREKTDEYIKPYTSGEAKVLKVLKGNFESSRISFLRLGGKVSFDEYTKSLYPSAREKLINSLESKSYAYVEEKSKNDIDIENGKTYLVYMNRNDKFHNKNEYTIEAFEYGLREIKYNDDNNKKSNISSSEILVKNNETNEYENIEQATSQKISKQFVNSFKY